MKPKKVPLGFFPTPLYELKHFGRRHTGHRIFIKRDDHTGLASGGNKTRKLEYLLGDAIARGADTVITGGAQQSNHCRQTAAACAMYGLACHLMLGGEEPPRHTGNLLLSKMLGATIHFTGEKRKGEDMEQLAGELRRQGRRPYLVTYGGSNAVGAMGYVEASAELKKQLQQQGIRIDYAFFASSSGGMQAGLSLGRAMYGLNTQWMPIQIDKAETGGMGLLENVRRIVQEAVLLLKGPDLPGPDISRQVNPDQSGPDSPRQTDVDTLGPDSPGQADTGVPGPAIPGLVDPDLLTPGVTRQLDPDALFTIEGYEKAGYGVMTGKEREAILTLARTEGILLDPVYTGRAFHAMADHLEAGRLERGTNVLFWHTGGLPANFSPNYSFF